MKLDLTRIGAAVVTAGLVTSLGTVAPVLAFADEAVASSAAVETTAAQPQTSAADATAVSNPVAKIGDVTYASLDEALAAANDGGAPLSCSRTASSPRPTRFPRP